MPALDVPVAGPQLLSRLPQRSEPSKKMSPFMKP